MRTVISVLALALFLLAPGTPGQAAPKPELAYAGYDCRETPPEIAPVEGRFSGDYEDLFKRLYPASYVRCFASMEACEAWRYDVQSAEVYYNIIYNQCMPRR